MEKPLLSGKSETICSEKGESERWSSQYAYVGKPIPADSVAGIKVSVDEIRSAASISYPSIPHTPPSTCFPQPHHYVNCQGGYYGEVGRATSDMQRPMLDEVEIRELLIDQVGHRCCWGSRPARTWRIRAVDDCNVYVATLDTFTEERETATETEPYFGGRIERDDDKKPEPGLWELDFRSEFPALFTPYKESRVRIPNSQSIHKCSGCQGRGSVVCPTCNTDLEDSGFYKEGHTSQCPACHGRGLIAHQDGSDSICRNCKGNGSLPCAACESRGLIECRTCRGAGSMASHRVGVVRWKTASARRVSAASGAASVPDEVFHRAKGVELWNDQAAFQCVPARFSDSYFLNRFSSDVIAERPPVPPLARVVCERHVVSVVPVTRVTMASPRRNRSFSFYIIGEDREVFLRDADYPSTFCWGLCPCIDWL